MRFVDEVAIKVQAGDGGSGCVSFHRAKYKPRGAPDGGDGGHGGSIYLQGTRHLNTLSDFRFKKLFKSANGQPGQGSNKTGASGESLILKVPLGTVVSDSTTGHVIAEILEDGETLCVAQGGERGVGNARFKSSTNRSPRQYTEGCPGDSKTLQLELKLIAQVGLLGLPNAGKSTLLRAVSNAHPKVADYPFTTCHPTLGVVGSTSSDSFTVADIPGLIEGASQGVGMGVQFLRHLERTQLLLHLVGLGPLGPEAPAEAIETVQNELSQYSDALTQTPQWLILNQVDLLTEDVSVAKQRLVDALHWTQPVFAISAVSGEGVSELCDAVRHYLAHHGPTEQSQTA